MHAADPKKSERMKRFLKVLKRGGAYTTLQLQKQARVCAVNSIAAELRQRGKNIICTRKNGLYYYMLART